MTNKSELPGMNRNGYDSDEVLIHAAFHAAFSEIRPDVSRLERKVLEGMKTNRKATAVRKSAGFFLAATLILTLLLGGIAVYAAAESGAFDRFRTRVNPDFLDVLNPVEQYVVSQGLRMEVIAAQHFGDRIMGYLSMQDLTGQNRFTENSRIRIDDRDIFRQLEAANAWDSSEGGMSMGFISPGGELVYINRETATAYFSWEIMLGIILPNEFELIVSEVIFDQYPTEVEFPMALSEMAVAETVAFPTPNSDINRILVPLPEGTFPVLPAPGVSAGDSQENHRQWISNVAIMDGRLHVQLANTRGSSSSTVRLYAPDGEWVFPEDQTWTTMDANLELQNPDSLLQASVAVREELQLHESADGVPVIPIVPPDPGSALYELYALSARFEAAPYGLVTLVFPIDVNNLDNYTLTLLGHNQHGIAGNYWAVTLDTGDEFGQIRTWRGSVPIGDMRLEFMSVTPLGVRFTGTFDGDIYVGIASRIGSKIIIETPAANITMEHSPHLITPHRFDGFSRTAAPVDVESVTAVIIDGVRVALD